MMPSISNQIGRGNPTVYLLRLFCWFFISTAILFQSCACQSISINRPPVISSLSQSLVVPEGSPFSLDCQAIGSPPIQYQWLRDDQPISLPAPSRAFSLVANRQNSGRYRCLAKNAFGAAISQQFNVTVAFLSAFEPVDPSSNFYRLQVSRGGSFVLTPPSISAAPFNNVRWKWYFYDSVINSNLTHYITQRGELVILNAKPALQGRYRVEAGLNDKTVTSQDFIVTVVDGVFGGIREPDPQIALSPKDTTYIDDSITNVDELILECVAQSSNLADVQLVWQHNGTAIFANGAQYSVERYGRRLVVKNPQFPKDSGLYSCEASRGFSTVRAQAWVKILQSPHIEMLSPETEGSMGKNVELQCSVRGEPRPSIKWYYNARLVNNKPVTADGSLLLSSLSASDTGIYQCEAKNPAGVDLVTTWLRIKSSGPLLNAHPQNVSAISGQEVRLTCQALGAPQPSITWKLNGTKIEPNGLTFRFEPGYLIIPSATIDHTGWYTCIATNSEGSTEEKAFVHVAGRIQIRNGPEDKSVVIGSNVVFPCKVVQEATSSQFTRNWYFNQQLLTAGSSRNIDLRPDGSLFIRQVGPNRIGSYTCTVTSPFGTRSQSGRLMIIEKPGMPLHVTAELINDTLPAKIKVSWTEGFDGNSPIIKHLVELRILGSKDLWSDWESGVENVGREQTMVLVDNLKPSASYSFRVITINRYGPGKPSVSSNNITLPQQPPAAAPRSVAGSPRSSSAIMIQWQPPPPDQWNGDILGYIIRYRLADYPDIPWIYRNISDTRARNVALEDLITWREYEIQVSAYNDRGMGVFSKSLYITTKEGVPTEGPSNVNVTILNSTAVYVAFTPPHHQMIPGVNLGYKVEAWLGSPAHGHLARIQHVLPYNLKRIETVLTGLEKYTAYNVTVVCYTAPGNGPKSSPIEIKTKQDVPGPVLNVHFDEVLDSSVTVVWTKPDQPNGLLTNYTLIYLESERTSTKRSVSILPTVTSHRVNGLTASTHYTFELFASTGAGRGPSEIVTMQSGVPPKLPGPPSSLVVTNVQPRSAILQFVPGFDGNTIIKQWIVEAQIGESTSWSLIYNISAPRIRSLTINTLHPFTTYVVRLIAKNVRGPSAPSEPSEQFQTQQTVPEGPPSDLSAEPDSATSVFVSWTPLPANNWNGKPKGYQLFFRKNSSIFGLPRIEPNLANNIVRMDEFSEVMISDSSSGEYRVKNLTPFELYEFKMFSVNDIGQSDPSSVLWARTYEAVPSAPPQNVQVTAENPTAVRVTWNEVPSDAVNGLILGYRVKYVPENPKIAFEQNEIEVHGAERRHYYLDSDSGLRPYTSYKISVCAFTVVGNGVTNEPPVVVRTLEDIPGPPSEVGFEYVGLTEVGIRWQKPYMPNGAILRYQVSHWANDSDERTATRSEPLASDLHLFIASGLQSQTTYVFTVAAETSVGWGQEAKVYIFTTNAKVPPPSPTMPVISSAHEKGARKLTIKWEIIETQTAPIRLIDIEHQKANEGHWVEWSERTPGTQKHATVMGLKPFTAYRFRIRAVNDFGKSQWSPESGWIKTMSDAPSQAPIDMEAKPHDSTSIKVSWREPPYETWNSVYVGYRILYKVYDKANETFQRKETPMRGAEKDYKEFIIEDLARFEHYMVQLQTFNQQGSSSTSSPVFVYVGHSIPKESVNNLVAEAKSSTQIEVAWDPWSDGREPISGFKVRHRPVSVQGAQWEEDVVKGSAMTVLRDLKKYTKYDIEVTAFNKAGQGPKSSQIAKTLEDRPGVVGELVFTDILLNSVNVSWAQPEEPNGKITGYRIVYKTYKLKEEFKKEIQEKISRTYFRPGNLEDNVTYTFSVSAETALGYGPPREGKVKIGPTKGSPDPPAKPVVYPSDDSVTLEWTNHKSGDSAIIGYIIQAKRIRNEKNRQKRQTDGEHPLGAWVIMTNVDGPNPQHEISYNDLQPNAVYVFRIFARNKQGVSYPSAQSDQVIVPEQSEAFYNKWWFLVIVACAFVVILLVVVLILCITGRNNKFRYEKRTSFDSLQLADGGVVAYELRASQRARALKHKTTYEPPRPDPSKGWYGEEGGPKRGSRQGERPPSYGSVIRAPVGAGSSNGSKPPSVYGSLMTDVVAQPSTSGYGHGHRASGNGYRNSNQFVDDSYEQKPHDFDTSTTGDDVSDSDHEEDKNISSIVQHYQTSDIAYRETWRRAKQTAPHNRPPSLSSAQSESFSVVNGSQMGAPQSANSRQPIPGFSSFV